MSSNNRWQNLERLIADGIRSIYQQLASDEERRIFCQQIGIADQELRKTNKINPDYTLPRMGEAYALKYHLQRADNLYTALHHINALYPLPKELQVLDIGSGTGGSTMATVVWVSRNMTESLPSLQVYGIEPMERMRTIADHLRQPFLVRIEQFADFQQNSISENIRHSQQVSSLEALIELEIEPRFDIILFSYTFPSQSEEEQLATLVKITRAVRYLKSGGILIFLTPKEPISKQEFMRRVSEYLTVSGIASELETNIRSGFYINESSFAPQKRPVAICDLRRAINRECRRLDIVDAFGENPRWDDPYYGFHCTLNVFIKN